MAQDQQNSSTDSDQTENKPDSEEINPDNQNVSQILNQDEIDSLLNGGGDADGQMGVRALLKIGRAHV